jgi:putative tryptophan/tyrosine transport system substrate-binding protein
MRRIGLVVVLAFSLILAPLAAEAQQAPKEPRIGYLSAGALTTAPTFENAFRQGLRELGYVEGRNIAIEYRWAEGKYERLLELAAELVRLKVDVILAVTTPAAQAAKAATRTIPIVFTLVADPVASGLVASLARPGGNITGLPSISSEIIGKQLELLKETVPGVSRVVVLQNPDASSHAFMVREAAGAARALGVQLRVLGARGPNALDAAFTAITAERADALLVLADPFFRTHRARIADFAAKSRLPSLSGEREQTEVGGLMSYGPSRLDLFQRAATYVDKILKGAKPAELPVEQPTKFELVINLKTAKVLGLTIPQSVLLRADQVIE